MKIYKIFPTTITEFNYEICKEEKSIIYDEIKFRSLNDVPPKQTTDKLHHMIPQFAKHILEVSNNILTEIYRYRYSNIEITSMWANKLLKGETHAPHTHSNNILSGVFYLKSGSPIQFYDPRPQAHVFHPYPVENNYENAGLFQFESDESWGFIFPSWLQHWVPPSTSDERISISWNILLRGEYGEPGSLQNAKI